MANVRMPTMADLAEVQTRERRREMMRNPSSQINAINELANHLGNPLTRTEIQENVLEYQNLVNTMDNAMTGHDWERTIVDRQEPTPLHVILEEWLRGHPLQWKHIESKIDMGIDIEDRLPMAVLAALWTARKSERTTGNQGVDKMNRELEIAVRNRGG